MRARSAGLWNIVEGHERPFGRALNELVTRRIRREVVREFPIRKPVHGEKNDSDEQLPRKPLRCFCYPVFVRRDCVQDGSDRRDRFDANSVFLAYRITTCGFHERLCHRGTVMLVLLRERGALPGAVEKMDAMLFAGEYSPMLIYDEMQKQWIFWLKKHRGLDAAKAYAKTVGMSSYV